MNYLNPPLLSLALSLFLLGCGSESDKPPLVPEIESIAIEGHETVSQLHSVGGELNLYGNIFYSDGTSSSTANELDWESNDSSIISVNNGKLVANANHGTVSISISYRNELFSESNESKIVEIIPIEEVNISSVGAPSLDINYSVIPPHADINTSGTYQLQAMGHFENNDSYDITTDIIWRSSNVTVATVGIATGDVITISSGHTDINISLYDEVNSTLSLDINLTD